MDFLVPLGALSCSPAPLALVKAIIKRENLAITNLLSLIAAPRRKTSEAPPPVHRPSFQVSNTPMGLRWGLSRKGPEQHENNSCRHPIRWRGGAEMVDASGCSASRPGAGPHDLGPRALGLQTFTW